MALDLQGFSTPVNQYEGLYKAADTSFRDMQRKEFLAHQEQARKSSLGSFLQNYLDPKDYLTGTVYDPAVAKQLGDIMQEGLKLANTDGVDANMLLMAISPKVNRLNEYTQKVKTVRGRVQEGLKNIPDKSGYNKRALEQEAMNAAFLNDKGDLIDMSEVDPNQDYISVAAKRNPLGVTDESIFGDAIKDFEVGSEKRGVKRQNAKGGYEKRMSMLKSRAIFDYDEDSQSWVPKYEIAKDGDKVMYGSFKDKNGKDVQAPIRMVPDQVYDYMIQKNPAIADRIRGEIQQYSGGKPLDVAQERMVGKMLMYENLKPFASGSLEDIEEVKANPAPKITVNVGGSGGDGTLYRKMYDNMKAAADAVDYKKKDGKALIDVDADAQAYAVDVVNKLKGKNPQTDEPYTQEDIYLRSEGGNLWIMDASVQKPKGGKIPSNAYLAKITRLGTDIKAQPGIKEKRGVIEDNPQGNASVLKAGTIVYNANGQAVKLKRDVSLEEIKKAGFRTNK